jgi:hypothetical protein
VSRASSGGSAPAQGVAAGRGGVEFVIQILHMEAVLASGAKARHREAWSPRYILVTLIRVCSVSSFTPLVSRRGAIYGRRSVNTPHIMKVTSGWCSWFFPSH